NLARQLESAGIGAGAEIQVAIVYVRGAATAAIRNADLIAVAVLDAKRHAIRNGRVPASRERATGEIDSLSRRRQCRCAERCRRDRDPVRVAGASLTADLMRLHLESPRKTAC